MCAPAQYKVDAAGGQVWRFPAGCNTAYDRELLEWSTVVDERAQFSKQARLHRRGR